MTALSTVSFNDNKEFQFGQMIAPLCKAKNWQIIEPNRVRVFSDTIMFGLGTEIDFMCQTAEEVNECVQALKERLPERKEIGPESQFDILFNAKKKPRFHVKYSVVKYSSRFEIHRNHMEFVDVDPQKDLCFLDDEPSDEPKAPLSSQDTEKMLRQTVIETSVEEWVQEILSGASSSPDPTFCQNLVEELQKLGDKKLTGDDLIEALLSAPMEKNELPEES